MIEVTSRHLECTLLTSNYSQMPAVALQAEPYFHGNGYFAVNGNLPSETILP